MKPSARIQHRRDNYKDNVSGNQTWEEKKPIYLGLPINDMFLFVHKNFHFFPEKNFKTTVGLYIWNNF